MLLLVALFSDAGVRELAGFGMLRGLALGISIFRLCAVEGGRDEACEWTMELSLKQDLGLEVEPEEQMYAITPAGKRGRTEDSYLFISRAGMYTVLYPVLLQAN